MGKKQKKTTARPSAPQSAGKDSAGLSLGDLLSAETLGKLKAQADEMKQAEASRKENLRKQEEERKKQEQKQRENDFAYLLDNSDQGWSKYK
jgi:hypothetical protein